MSLEHGRSCMGSDPHVTKRLCATIMFFIGVICIFGGYLLGRMARAEVRRSNDIISANLTNAADSLYKKAKRMAPKSVHHNDPEKITTKLLEMFHCTQAECGSIINYNVAEFVRNSINYEVSKLIKSIQNASLFLDSLR